MSSRPGSVGLRREVAFTRDVGRTQPGRVRRRRAGIAGEVEADGEVREGRDRHVDGIAHDHHPGRHLDPRPAGERQRAIGAGDDARILVADGDVRGTDFDRRPVERVRQLHAHATTADARAEDHPHRLVGSASGAAAGEPSLALSSPARGAESRAVPSRGLRR